MCFIHSVYLCKCVSFIQFVIMYCVLYCLPLVTVYCQSEIKVLFLVISIYPDANMMLTHKPYNSLFGSVPDEAYSRDASCALNLISTFYWFCLFMLNEMFNPDVWYFIWSCLVYNAF